MKLLTELAIGLVALMHGLFLILEMFLWRTHAGRSISGLSAEMAVKTSTLAANLGIYNGFLASGLIWSLYISEFSFELRVFFLGCVITAGLFGAFTVSRIVFFVQALPGIIALVLVLFGQQTF
jgi:putative membrane protein